MPEQCLIVIPALNPPKDILSKYVDALLKRGFTNILLVNDGSDDHYQFFFEELVNKKNCSLITHPKNLGKGRALKNSLSYYLNESLQNELIGVITVDSDGQHTPSDIENVFLALKENILKKQRFMILGAREFDKDLVPFRSQFGNVLTRSLFKIFYGLKLADTQTGLRAFGNNIIHELINLEGERYEYEMNTLIYCALNSIDIHEVPIQTIYIDDNKGSHFDPIKDSLKIYRVLIGTFIKYVSVSLSSFLLDIGIFRLALAYLQSTSSQSIVISTITARVFSSLFNYFVNKNYVFRSKSKVSSSMLKYYTLAVFQMGVSALLVSSFFAITGRFITLIKVLTDTTLFFISFRIQQKYIFKDN